MLVNNRLREAFVHVNILCTIVDNYPQYTVQYCAQYNCADVKPTYNKYIYTTFYNCHNTH